MTDLERYTAVLIKMASPASEFISIIRAISKGSRGASRLEPIVNNLIRTNPAGRQDIIRVLGRLRGNPQVDAIIAKLEASIVPVTEETAGRILPRYSSRMRLNPRARNVYNRQVRLQARQGPRVQGEIRAAPPATVTPGGAATTSTPKNAAEVEAEIREKATE